MADFSITGDVRLNSDPAEQSVNKWTVAAGQMIADFARKASDALMSVVRSGLSYNRDMESYLTNFKVMLGDEQLAAEKLEAIRKMAASTPFSLSDLTEGTQTLLQFGIAADDTTGVLKMLGDISLGNADKMQTLVRAYGKMSSAQKVTLENVNMMIDAGFNPLNQICDATGESMSDLYKRISDGKVGFNELEEAVKAATSEGGQFYNGMLEASQTFNGRLSTLQDNISAFLGTLSDSLFEAGSELLPWANDVILNLTDALKTGSPEAMLTAAGEIISDLVSGITQKLPSLITSATQIIVQFTHYLSDHAGDLMDAGLQIVEQLIVGIVDNLPAIITAAAELLAKFLAASLARAPEALKIGLALCTAIVDGIVRSLENLAEAALACIAKLLGIWDGNMDEWGHIGENIVKGLLNGITGMWDTLVSTVKNKVSGMVSTVKNLLGIHSPSKVFGEIGENVTQGLANGINAGAPEAEQAVAEIAETLATYGPDFASAGALLTSQVSQKLTDGWDKLQSDIQTDALGVIESLGKAVTSGDLESIGMLAAETFWNACTEEQQSQIMALASGALNQLNSSLTGVCTQLVQMAESFVGQFVPAAGAAATAQDVFNAALDANPVMAVISLIGLLVTAFVNLAKNNESVGKGIKAVWSGVQDFLSLIFEGILRVVAVGISGFVLLINGLIDAYNSVAWLWDGKVEHIKNPATAFADKLKAEREQRAAQKSAEQEQAELDAKYAKESGEAEKKQLEAKYNKKQADLEKARLSDTDPKRLSAEQAVAKADYEQSLADLEAKLLDAQYKKKSAEISKKATTDKAELAKLEKEITEADSTLKMGELEKQLLKLDYDKTLADLEKKYAKTSAKKNDTSPKDNNTTPDPGQEKLTEAVEANTEALLAANSKLAEMVRKANSLVLSDNMAISRSVAASGTAQIAAAANSYHREGDTNITQNIYSKAQTAADLQREARWEADRAKAQKR